MGHFDNHAVEQWMHTIPIAVVGASILGSGHCIAMCGGLAMTVARDRWALLRYHLGRLMGYCGLGAIAGYLGEALFNSKAFAVIPWLSTVLLSLGFIIFGIHLWKGKPLHFFRLPSLWWSSLSRSGPTATGFLSAFLPCGWLHTFVLGALATRSRGWGALYLLCFWLGTLPALSFASTAVRRIFQPITIRAPKLSAVILISIGIGTLGMKMAPQHSPVCSCDENEDLNLKHQDH